MRRTQHRLGNSYRMIATKCILLKLGAGEDYEDAHRHQKGSSPCSVPKDSSERRAIRSLSEAVNTTPFHGIGARFESGRDHHTGA